MSFFSRSIWISLAIGMGACGVSPLPPRLEALSAAPPGAPLHIDTSSMCQPASSACHTVESRWHFSHNDVAAAHGHPRQEGDTVYLLPDALGSASSVAWLDQSVTPPYEVSFEYRIIDQDGGWYWNSADGLAMIIGKNNAAYGSPPTGRARGFSRDGTGLGVHFNIFGPPAVLITDGLGKTLVEQRVSIDLNTRGAWQNVEMRVWKDGIDVYVAGEPLVTWQGPVPRDFATFGIAAATGAKASAHAFRNFELRLPLGQPRPEPIYEHAQVISPWAINGADYPCVAVDEKSTHFSQSGPVLALTWNCPLGFSGKNFDRGPMGSTDHALDPQSYTHLEFDLNPGTAVDAASRLLFNIRNGSPGVAIADFVAPAPLAANTWHPVRMPLSALDATGVPFSRLLLFNPSANHQNFTVYLDNLRFTGEAVVPPTIFAFTVVQALSGSVEVQWQTAAYATCTGVLGDEDTAPNPSIGRLHRLRRDNLRPSTRYPLEVRCFIDDRNGLPPWPVVRSFSVVTAPPDTTPPQISAAWLGRVESSYAEICFDTNEPAQGLLTLIAVSDSNSVAPQRRHREAFENTRCITVSGLLPGTTYRYEIEAIDRFENRSWRDDFASFITPDPIAVAVQVVSDAPVHRFSPNMLGGNIPPWVSWGRVLPNQSPKFRELISLIRPGIIRIGGGNTANRASWPLFDAGCDTSGVCQATCGPLSTSANAYHGHEVFSPEWMQDYAAFAAYVGAQLMVQVNVVTCNPAMWADMVGYLNNIENLGVRYFELGNELDLAAFVGSGPIAANDLRIPKGVDYAERFDLYAAAMRQADDSIVIVGPATAAHEENDQFKPYSLFFEPLIAGVNSRGAQLDMLSYHYYPKWDGQRAYAAAQGRFADDAQVLDDLFALGDATDERSRSHVASCVADKRRLLDEAGLQQTQLAITEFNVMTANAVPTQLNRNHVGALYMADMLGRLAYHGVDAALNWTLVGGSTEAYGLIDHNEWSITRDEVQPRSVYYTYLLYAQFFGDHMVRVHNQNEAQVSVWASTFDQSDKDLAVMLVNLTQKDAVVSLDLGHKVALAQAYHLTNEAFVEAPNAEKLEIDALSTINGLSLDLTSAQSIKTSFETLKKSGRLVQPDDNSVRVGVSGYSAVSLRVTLQ